MVKTILDSLLQETDVTSLEAQEDAELLKAGLYLLLHIGRFGVDVESELDSVKYLYMFSPALLALMRFASTQIAKWLQSLVND